MNIKKKIFFIMDFVWKKEFDSCKESFEGAKKELKKK